MISEILIKEIHSYKEWILSDISNNKKIREVINKVYFNSKIDIFDIVSTSIIKDFSDYVNNVRFVGYPSPFEELGDLNIDFLQVNRVSEIGVFRMDEFNSYNDAAKNYPNIYYYINYNFFDALDGYVLSHLNEYDFLSNGKYHKRINEELSFCIDFLIGREKRSFLYDYKLPFISIKYKGEEYFQRGDPRSFLFIGDLSFSTFYYWCNNIHYDQNNNVTSLEPKVGEPVIYYFEENNKYTITNSYENVRGWNKYIEIIVGLFVYYLSKYEEWVKLKFTSSSQ